MGKIGPLVTLWEVLPISSTFDPLHAFPRIESGLLSLSFPLPSGCLLMAILGHWNYAGDWWPIR